MDKLQLERMCFPITLRCNLRCKLCSERSPYYSKPYHPSFSELRAQVDALFGLVKHIGKFDITGGEPFLHHDLSMFIEYIHNVYRHRVDKLRLTTNGTQMPPEGFIKAAALWGESFYTIVDNYGVPNVSKSVGELLTSEGIPHEVRDYSDNVHCDGWVNYGDLTLKHNYEGAKKLLEKCIVSKLGFFTCMVDGRIYPCSRARMLYENGIVDVSMDAFDNDLTESGKVNRLSALLSGEVVQACKYCNGLCKDSERFMPAEQINYDEKQESGSKQEQFSPVQQPKMLIYTQAFNSEKTVTHTIESVLSQTNRDFIYILVNNGSRDNTESIMRNYLKSDKRIILINCNKNDLLGAVFLPQLLFKRISVSRNNTYFCIVDADDIIKPNFIESTFRAIEKYDPDMVVPGYCRIDAVSNEVVAERVLESDLLVRGSEKAKDFYKLRPLLISQWGKAYKLKSYGRTNGLLVNNRFPEIAMWSHHEDTIEVLGRFYLAGKVVFIADILYEYYLHPQAMSRKYHPKRYLSDLTMLMVYKEFLSRFGSIDNFNLSYCYAIYLSVVEVTVNIVIEEKSLTMAQKLQELKDILQLGETKTMLTFKADKTFSNLASRLGLLAEISNWLNALQVDDESNEKVIDLQNVLAQYDI